MCKNNYTVWLDDSTENIDIESISADIMEFHKQTIEEIKKNKAANYPNDKSLNLDL